MAGSTLLISDIHADAGALDQILGLAFSESFSRRYGPVEKVLNLGDVMERGYYPKEAVDRLKSLKNVESILGNHDEAFLRLKSLSGSDMASISAHEQYRKTREYESFFKDMGLHYIDRELKLYAVHGGPLDPGHDKPLDLGHDKPLDLGHDKPLDLGHDKPLDLGHDRPLDLGAIAGSIPQLDDWLFSQTWQRISDLGFRYLDSSGYHYLPEDAFESMNAVFEGTGYVIVCGHEHQEAAYVKKNGRVENVMGRMEKSTIRLGERETEEKKLPMKEDACYLVRIGLAGPEGYSGIPGFGNCHFGVISPDPKTLYLLSFRRE